MRRVAVWLLAVLLCICVGSVLGQLLDALLWHLSLDYVFPPGRFARQGLQLGVLCGTITAALATVGSLPVARPGPTTVSILLGAGLVVFSSLLGGLIGGVIGKYKPEQASVLTLAPVARVMCCEGLWRGAAIGAWVATVLVGIQQMMDRRRSRHQAIP